MAPELEEPDEIEHFGIGPGREVFELADDLLFYLAHTCFTSAGTGSSGASIYISLSKEEVFTGAIYPLAVKKLSGGLREDTEHSRGYAGREPALWRRDQRGRLSSRRDLRGRT